MKKVLTLAITLLFLSSVGNALPLFNGSLMTPGGVDGTGIWADNFKIEWWVEQQLDDNWFYKYHLTETDGRPLDPGAVSHWIVEVSPNVTLEDFWGFSGEVEINDWVTETGFSFPSGLKLDYGADGQTEWTFYSTRAPVWGDFFAKDGVAGGAGLNAAWNAGFFDPDPTDAAANGSIGNKILRPDTYTVIPEPTTLGLLGLGLAGLALRRFRRK
jgi:hypothetical protein